MTVGTPDANGAAVNSEGFFKITVIVDAPGPPDGSDLLLNSRITDVRCKAGTTACGNANSADGADYIGDLKSDATIRITDHFNAVTAGGGPDPATVVDLPFPVMLSCSNTSSTSIGGDCTINTSYSACARAIRGSRAGVFSSRWRSSRSSTVARTASFPRKPEQNAVFMRQGLFIP